MTLFIRYCGPCNRAFPATVAKCPACGEPRAIEDAVPLIERLGADPQDPDELAEVEEMRRRAEATDAG